MSTETPTIRTNIYGGNFRTCTRWVEAGEGRLDRPHSSARWVTYHLTDADCGEAKTAPAPTMPNRYEGGCTRCGDIVAPGEGTLRRLDYTWGSLTHDVPCEDRGVIERRSAGDFANVVKPWPETFEQDGRWYHVTWARWTKSLCTDTDEWHPAVHQVARPPLRMRSPPSSLSVPIGPHEHPNARPRVDP